MKRSNSAIYNLRRNERGIVLITVMVVIAICVGIVAVMLERYMVTEARDIELEILEIRTHWAMMGHVNYSLSRAMGDYDNSGGGNNTGICNGGTEAPPVPLPIETDCADDNERIGILQTYLSEIQTILSNGNQVRLWAYDEFPTAAYFLNIRSEVTDDDGDLAGRMLFTTRVPTQVQGEDLGSATVFENYRPRSLLTEICFSNNGSVCTLNEKQGRGFAFITQHRIN